jgi:hypothetical protein
VTAQLATALFYPRALVRTQLLQLVAGVLDDPSLDVVQFDVSGGSAERDLAIPFLPAMDEVVVSDASLELEARPLELELPSSDYTVSKPTGDDAGKGVIVRRCMSSCAPPSRTRPSGRRSSPRRRSRSSPRCTDPSSAA